MKRAIRSAAVCLDALQRRPPAGAPSRSAAAACSSRPARIRRAGEFGIQCRPGRDRPASTTHLKGEGSA